MDKYLHKKVVEIPIYRGKLVILLGNDVEKLTSVLSEWDKDEEPYAHAWRLGYKGWKSACVVLNFHHSKSKINHGIVAHEAMHATHFIAQDSDIDFDFDNPEPITYLLEWVTNEIHKFIHQKGFKVEI